MSDTSNTPDNESPKSTKPEDKQSPSSDNLNQKTDAPSDSKTTSASSRKSLDDLIQEQESSKKKVAMKKHPLLDKKNKRKAKLQGARASKVNPFIQILDQHQTHKLRIAKITALVVLVLVAIGLIIFSVQEWQKSSKTKAILGRIDKKLAELDIQIKEKQGYEKYRTALKATKVIDSGYFVDDPNNYNKWLQRKAHYASIIQKSYPEPKTNFINPDTLIDMVSIPQGRFNIGRKQDDRGSKNERPRHPVMIPYDFWMSRYETTTSQYRLVFQDFRCKRWSGYQLGLPSQPVVRVSWHDAKEYCRVLTHWAKKEGKLPIGYEYRLPTEAEWEYACKAGTDTTYYWGEEFGKVGAKFANSLDKVSAKRFGLKVYKNMAPNDGYRVSAPVGKYEPNAFGLYDMSGNVWEWCLDWYNPKAYSELPHTSPVQTKPVVNRMYELRAFDAGKNYFNSTSKVIRGGSWGNQPFDLRSTNRDHQTAETKNTGIGFRIVLSKKLKYIHEKSK